jgi:tetrahydromethanopterin S-methyltransferase subunit G
MNKNQTYSIAIGSAVGSSIGITFGAVTNIGIVYS